MQLLKNLIGGSMLVVGLSMACANAVRKKESCSKPQSAPRQSIGPTARQFFAEIKSPRSLPSCSTCIYFDRHETAFAIDDDDDELWAMGDCHRNPPVAVCVEGEVEGHLPTTYSDSFCGEYAPLIFHKHKYPESQQ